MLLKEFLSECDAKLHCLADADTTEAEQSIRRLLVEVDPVIGGVVRALLNEDEMAHQGQDLCQDARIAIWHKLQKLYCTLQKLKSPLETEPDAAVPDTSPIGSLTAYARRAAKNRVQKAFCEQNPCWCRMRRRLIYLFDVSPRLKLLARRSQVRDDDASLEPSAHAATMCGLAAWQVRNLQQYLPGMRAQCTDRLRRLQEDGRTWIEQYLQLHPDTVKVDETLVEEILKTIGGPVNFQSFVTLCSRFESFLPVRTVRVEPIRLFDQLADPRFLDLFWSGVKELSLQQKQAILYDFQEEIARNAASGEGDRYSLVQHFAENSNYVTYPDIARVLEIDMSRLYTLLGELPLDDTGIAQVAKSTAGSIKVSRSKGMSAIKTSLKKRYLSDHARGADAA